MSEWQPIETAPPSTRVLLWNADANSCCFGKVYKYPDTKIIAIAEGYNGEWDITHWMPLPERPDVHS